MAKKTRRTSLASLAGPALMTLCLSVEAAGQVTGTWVGADGVWSLPTNWSSNPQVPGMGGEAHFVTTTGSGDYPSLTLDIPVSLSRIVVGDTQFTPLITGSTITMVGVAEVFTTRGKSESAAAYYPLRGTAIESRISGTSGITKTGPGPLALDFANNDYVGDTRVLGGQLLIQNASALGHPTNRVVLDGGALISQYDGGGNTLTLNRAVHIGSNGGTLGAHFDLHQHGTIDGPGALNYLPNSNSGRFILHVPAEHTGPTNTFAGISSVVLVDNGSIRESAAINLHTGNLVLSNTAVANSDRIGDEIPIQLGVGSLVLESHPTQPVEERLGTVNVRESARLWLRSGPGGNNGIRAGALTRTGRGVVRFTIDTGSEFRVDAPPALSGGGGAPGTTSMSIVPFATATGSSSSVAEELVTYDAGRIRALAATEYAGSLTSGIVTQENVRLSGGTHLASPTTVNSIRLARGSLPFELSGSAPLTVTSGVFVSGANVVNVPLNFGTAEGVISGGGTMTSPVSGSNGVTFNNPLLTLGGQSTYTGQTTIREGAISLLDDVTPGSPGPFGAENSPIHVSNAAIRNGTPGTITVGRAVVIDTVESAHDRFRDRPSIRLGNTSTGTLVLSGGITGDTRVVLNGNVLLTGGISGNAKLSILSNTLAIFSGDNSFTGGLDLGANLTNAKAVAASDTAFGSGSIQLGSGEIAAAGGERTLANPLVLVLSGNIGSGSPLTFTGGLEIGGSSDNLLTVGSDVIFAGQLDGGPLSLSVIGGHRVSLTSANPSFVGEMDLLHGTLRMTHAAALGSPLRGTTVQSGATLCLEGDTAVAAEPLSLRGQGLSSGGALRSVSGSNRWSAPVMLQANSTIGVDTQSLTLEGGISAAGATTILTKVGDGALIVAPHLRLPALTIDEGSVAIRENGLEIGASHLGTLTISGGSAPTATLDAADNDLVVASGDLSTAINQIAHARNAGAWDQHGITSSAAANDPTGATMLGVLSGLQYRSVYGPGATFDGFEVVDGNVLVKYTYYGDSDFNGSIDFDDYVRTDAGFNTGGDTWFEGDFDLNGVLDFDDYVLIDLGFNTQNGTLRRAQDFLDGTDRSMAGMDAPGLQIVARHFEEFGIDYAVHFLAAVPEPGAVGVFMVGARCLTRRRRPPCRCTATLMSCDDF